MAKRVNFTMPGVEYQPLEKLLLTSVEFGRDVQRPALHKDWVEERAWMHFTPLTKLEQERGVAGAQERWLEAAEEQTQDLHWLLSLPHHCFWSQVMYDTGVRDALVSYLQRSPRCYDGELKRADAKVKHVLFRIHSMVLRVYLRIGIAKESKSCFISREFHGQILYDHFLLDVPTMLDLSVLYGRGARPLLSRLLTYSMEVQPRYREDLTNAAGMVIKSLKTVETYFIPLPSEESIAENSKLPLKLSQQAPGPKGDLTSAQLNDMVLFLLDTLAAVSSLLDLLPDVGPIFHSSMIEIELSHFYENVLPLMYHTICAISDDTLSRDLQGKLDCARYHLLEIAKATLCSRVSTIVEKVNQTDVSEMAEEYLTVLGECLAEPRFIRDLHIVSPIDVDLDTLLQICPDQLDSAKYDFFIESVLSCFELPSRKQLRQEVQSRTKQSPASKDEGAAAAAGPSHADSNGAGAFMDEEIAIMESLVTDIQDMLPDLGAGFLQRCLRQYNMNKEDVVNAILEESLPADLSKLDRTMPLPAGPVHKDCPGPSLPVRLNVFDHDEFDVMSHDNIDTSRVHRGKKKSKHRNLVQLLDDKEELKGLRDVYSRYSQVQEGLYDDEYDDTYDDVDIGVSEVEEAERRPMVVPRVLETRPAEVNEVEDEYDEEDAESDRLRDTRDDFAQDPALLRAQAEQRRASKLGQSYRPPSAPRDVVGKPKGHGQEKNVVLNRQKKNTNKSSGANHNRRAGAQRKMQQGMVPS